ncbi:MAG TPA: putative Ig domain-containing protein, partial [Gammaproteobacteria bacterium]|nr:putative Ig domain-containing protein [Gammaproteobacteria bacterium]
SDPDSGSTLTFSVANKPTWATFSASTGQLQGTPTAAGTFASIAISVSDGQASASLPAFSIVVTQPNRPPTISGTPTTTGSVGTAYTFTPTASDPDSGTTLTFSITNRPAWATFNGSTGRLSGTPTAAGTFANITISVSDGQASASLAAFSIVVTQPNRPPTISGTPPTTIVTGTAYTFTPTASDPDTGSTLTFSVANKPSWATFDSARGTLAGTPGAGDVGSYANIVISVSDGQASASLPAFSIAVQAVATGSATLTWSAPTQNSDGSPLTDLAGYKVYWGTSSHNYSGTAALNNPGLATYVVDGLASSNTYYFAITAVNSTGTESSPSNEASKTIQ